MTDCTDAPYVLYHEVGYSKPALPPSVSEPGVTVTVAPGVIHDETDPPRASLILYAEGIADDDPDRSLNARDLTVGDTATFRGYTVTILAICYGQVGFDVTQE